MRGAERNPDAECRTATFRAFDVDGAAVLLDEFLYQRKADPRALEAAAAGALDPVEAVKEPGKLRSRNAGRIRDGPLIAQLWIRTPRVIGLTIGRNIFSGVTVSPRLFECRNRICDRSSRLSLIRL